MGDPRNIVMRFPTETGGARMFLATMGSEETSIRDVDHDVVIAEGLFRNTPPSSRPLFESMLANMDWGAFSRWLPGREQYKSPAADYDLDTGFISQGDPERQRALIDTRATDWSDARTAEMIALNDDPVSGMRFHPMSKDEMVMALMSHEKTLDPSDGRSRLSWHIPVRDMTMMRGAPGDGEATDPDVDQAWATVAASEQWRDLVLEKIGERMVTDPRVSLLAANDGVVTLEGFDGEDLSFASVREMGARMSSGPIIADVLLNVRKIDVFMRDIGPVIADIALEERERFERDNSSPSEIDM